MYLYSWLIVYSDLCCFFVFSLLVIVLLSLLTNKVEYIAPSKIIGSMHPCSSRLDEINQKQQRHDPSNTHSIDYQAHSGWSCCRVKTRQCSCFFLRRRHRTRP